MLNPHFDYKSNTKYGIIVGISSGGEDLSWNVLDVVERGSIT